VGGYLVKALAGHGIPESAVLALSSNERALPGAHKTIQVDITDSAKVYDLIAAYRPAAVVHLAAVAQPAKAARNQDLAWQVNVEGTRNLARAIMLKAPQARLVFASSSETYGASFNDWPEGVAESVSLRPMSAYGATKAAADVALGQMAIDGLDVIRFRAFNHTGPGQAPNYVVPAFAEQVARIEAGIQPPVMQVGNLDACRDFLDVRDVVKAYVLAALGQGLPGRAYNLSSGTGRPIQSVLDTLQSFTDVQIDVEIDPNRVRPSDVPYAIGNNSAVKSDFGWTPEFPFEQTLRDVLDGYRATHAF
jgi:GDP-4-dehydro-6-deoxy-D-mannose reductase